MSKTTSFRARTITILIYSGNGVWQIDDNGGEFETSQEYPTQAEADNDVWEREAVYVEQNPLTTILCRNVGAV